MRQFMTAQAGEHRCGLRGRRKALAALDQILGPGTNEKVLLERLQAELDRDTLKFFREIIMPLIPKRALRCHDHDQVVQWQPLSAREGGNQ